MTNYVEVRQLLPLEVLVTIGHSHAPFLKVVYEVFEALRRSEIDRKVRRATATGHSNNVERYLIEITAQILKYFEVEGGRAAEPMVVHQRLPILVPLASYYGAYGYWRAVRLVADHNIFDPVLEHFFLQIFNVVPVIAVVVAEQFLAGVWIILVVALDPAVVG